MKKVLGALALVLVLVLGCAAIASADAGIDPNNIPEGKVVNWGDLCSITRIAGHDIVKFDPENPTGVTLWPTCTEYGEIEFDCIEKAGEVDPATEKHYHILRIAPLGHDWASESGDREWGIVIKKPTCTEKGLAQDVCLRCWETREKYREIDKLPHEYYDVEDNPYYKAPTCTETGLGKHKCIYCGQLKPNEKESEMAVIPKLPHNFTEWMQIEQPTCAEYGAAERMCVWCGMHQKLDGTDAHDILDEDGNHMRDYVWAVAKLNPNWKSYDGKEFKSRTAYNSWLWGLDFEYDNSHKWLLDCYTRLVTFTCPYCRGTIHEDFTIKQVAPFTISHVWKTTPDPELSVAPTCLEDGKNVYLCIYDGFVHDHAGVTFEDEFGNKVKDPQMKVEKVPALGHDWSDLKVAKSYWKDGEWWDLWVATCDRCGATQEEAKLAPEGPKDPHGFILCDDGIWRLYDDGEVKDFTGFYNYDGAEFFLVNGVLVDFNGMVNCPGDKWVFMSHGRKINVSKLVEYAGEWFFVEDGELDTSKNGIYWYDGARFVFSMGRLCKELNGLWQDPNDGTWWFIANGQVQDQYKGVALYDGAFFLLDWGQLDVWYDGTLWYDGAEFKVVEGQLYAV